MKQITIYATAAALAASMSACNLFGSGSNSGDEVYNDEAYEVTADNVIDPYDMQAYRMYGASGDQQSFEAEETTTIGEIEEPSYEEKDDYSTPSAPSSGEDMVKVNITNTAQVNKLLDQFDSDINNMSRLVRNKAENTDAILELNDHIVKITEKMNEAAEAGYVTEAQLARYQTLVDKFLAVVKANT